MMLDELEIGATRELECNECGKEESAFVVEEGGPNPFYARFEESKLIFYCKEHFPPLQAAQLEARKQKKRADRLERKLDQTIAERAKEHARWKRYSGRWEENRAEALERAGFECQSCGMTQEQHSEEYGFELHVHHVRPVGEYEDYDDAHNMENLAALCLDCHAEWETDHEHVQLERLGRDPFVLD